MIPRPRRFWVKYLIVVIVLGTVICCTRFISDTVRQQSTAMPTARCYERIGFVPLKPRLSEAQQTMDLANHLEKVHEGFTFPTTHIELISQLQTLQQKTLGPIMRNFKFAMLFGLYTDENKGDPAIGLGEIMFLRKYNIEVIFHCEQSNCRESLRTAIEMSRRYSSKKLVILLQGGGGYVTVA